MGTEKGRCDVLDGVLDKAASNVANPVNLVADPRDKFGKEHQVLPVRFFLA